MSWLSISADQTTPKFSGLKNELFRMILWFSLELPTRGYSPALAGAGGPGRLAYETGGAWLSAGLLEPFYMTSCLVCSPQNMVVESNREDPEKSVFQETQAEATRLLLSLPENPRISLLQHSVGEGKGLK